MDEVRCVWEYIRKNTFRMLLMAVGDIRFLLINPLESWQKPGLSAYRI